MIENIVRTLNDKLIRSENISKYSQKFICFF